MSFEELETFVQIAQLGGFTAASVRLGRSQPAISRRVRQLEETLEAPLFERVGRGVVLTEAGSALLPFAEAALAAVRDGMQAALDAGQANGAEQKLDLAIVGTLADSKLVDALRSFETKFENVRVELRTATSREVSNQVRSGEADLGLRYFPDANPRLENVELGEERLFVVVPSVFRIRASRIRDISRLGDERWVGFPPDRAQPESFGALLESFLGNAGLGSARITQVDSLTAQKRLIEAGLGIGLMPRSSVREEIRIGSLRTIAIPRPELSIPVVAVRRRSGYTSALAAAFLERLQRTRW